MAIDTNKYNLLYGKILTVVKDAARAKILTNVLYNVSDETGVSHADMLKYVTENGIRFNNIIYNKLNELRTNSSQLGFVDGNNVPKKLAQQINLSVPDDAGL